MKIILASNNKGKIKELKDKLGNKYEVLSLLEVGIKEDIEEFGITFEQNALIKAQYIAKKFPDDFVIADDSGLEIKALKGEPGVYSARYAQDEKEFSENSDLANIKKVLNKLSGIENRDAKFVTVLCVIKPNEKPIFIRGEVSGYILQTITGNGGFGYDPIFTADNINSFAEMSLEEKQAISHRGLALKALFEEKLF